MDKYCEEVMYNGGCDLDCMRCPVNYGGDMSDSVYDLLDDDDDYINHEEDYGDF